MRIKEVTLNGFKRFRQLKLVGLSDSIKLVMLVGPNGCGKSSIFEAFNHWYKYYGFGRTGESDFYVKKGAVVDEKDWYVRTVQLEFWDGRLSREQIHKVFYFRTAYRNEAEFTTDSIERLGDPSDRIRFEKLIATDSVVSSNYKRLASLTLKGVYSGEHDAKSVKDLRELLIGRVQNSMLRVFESLQLEGVGDPLVNGSFYFTKGTSKGFHYKNLSAGEKSAFDLILDMIVQSQYYPQAVYCIDEPETHMHTSLQSKLMTELYALIPDEGQMWVASHSLGMLKTAREIEAAHPGTVAFFDFTDLDFDETAEVRPMPIGTSIWNRFLDLALGDLADLVAPQTVVFCEGNPLGTKNKNFDAQIYQRIFSDLVPAPVFVSVGSCNDVMDDNNVGMSLVKSVLTHSKIIRLVDRDNRSAEEIADAARSGIRVLSRRHLESYLLDDEVLRKLCERNGCGDAIGDVLEIKRQAIEGAVGRGRDDSDIKAAAPTMIEGFRRRLVLRNAGNLPATFLRDTIAPLITQDMSVYQQLKHDIFEL